MNVKRYTISEGDYLFEYDADTYFELDVYHTKTLSPEEFKFLVERIILNGNVTTSIRDIARILCIEYGFFTINCEVCVHLGDGLENYSKETLCITHPDPADE